MILKSIFFVSGVYIWQYAAPLPPPVSWLLLLSSAVLLWWPATRLSAMLLSGFSWATLVAGSVMSAALAPGLAGENVLLQGHLIDRPLRTGDRVSRFHFQVTHASHEGRPLALAGTVRLDWYGRHPDLAAGQRWQLVVRLKRPRGFANPGGFDYARWMFQQRIQASGYVRDSRLNRQTGHVTNPPWLQLRQQLQELFDRLGRDIRSMSLIRALAIGDRSGLSQRQWDVLRATGTGHLMAISGLHISLVAGLVLLLARCLLAGYPMALLALPAIRPAALAALLAALSYALLSGFAIPARRALVMVAVAMLAMLMNRRSTLTHTLALAAVVTLLYDPLSLLSAGWWLSFWAVTVIAWTSTGRRGCHNRLTRWLSLHGTLAVCMAPLSLLYFSEASLLAPVANSVAIPVVGFLVVPLSLGGCLLSLLSEAAAAGLLQCAALLLELLWLWLEWLAALPLSVWVHQPAHALVVVAAVAGLALLFMPRGLPGRWLSLCLLSPLVLAQPQRPAVDTARVTLLDVGQGLSAVVETARHTLVYDTGPRFNRTFDTGRAVVVPYLRHSGTRRLDMLVVSHGDNDHIGGVRSLRAAFEPLEILSSVPERLTGSQVGRCRAGQHWNWDGVSFEMLHPPDNSRLSGNDASCVLRISAAGSSLLLTGDIEASAESALLRSRRRRLQSSVLVLPHHGSNTSSSGGFLSAVNPRVVLVPAGWRNRYGFPRPEIMQRITALGAEVHVTGVHGALQLNLAAAASTPRIRRQRDRLPRFWQQPD